MSVSAIGKEQGGSHETLLQHLGAKTFVDCDTLDLSIVQALGPFEDCTSNQAIAYFELLNTRHEDLLRRSASSAKQLSSKYPQVRIEALTVEICVSVPEAPAGPGGHHD